MGELRVLECAIRRRKLLAGRAVGLQHKFTPRTTVPIIEISCTHGVGNMVVVARGFAIVPHAVGMIV